MPFRDWLKISHLHLILLGGKHVKTINCPKCNEKINSNTSFCPYCGYPLVLYRENGKYNVPSDITSEKSNAFEESKVENTNQNAISNEEFSAYLTGPEGPFSNEAKKTMDSEVGNAIDAKSENIINGFNSVSDSETINAKRDDSESSYILKDNKNNQTDKETAAKEMTEEQKIAADLEIEYLVAEEIYKEHDMISVTNDSEVHAEIAQRAKNQARAIMSSRAKAKESHMGSKKPQYFSINNIIGAMFGALCIMAGISAAGNGADPFISVIIIIAVLAVTIILIMSGKKTKDSDISPQIIKSTASNPNKTVKDIRNDEMQDARSYKFGCLIFIFALVLMLVGFFIAFSQNPDPKLIHSIL